MLALALPQPAGSSPPAARGIWPAGDGRRPGRAATRFPPPPATSPSAAGARHLAGDRLPLPTSVPHAAPPGYGPRPAPGGRLSGWPRWSQTSASKVQKYGTCQRCPGGSIGGDPLTDLGHSRLALPLHGQRPPTHARARRPPTVQSPAQSRVRRRPLPARARLARPGKAERRKPPDTAQTPD